MKILITGATGMVARAAIRYCNSIGDETLPLSHSQLDISDREAVRRVMASVRPDAVLNCAAYTNVDGAETEIERCRAANVTGVENLAGECGRFGAAFVTISTDYVFDGEKDGFYTENDTPNPRGVYAVSKFEGEKAALAVNKNSIIVRSGWIFGHGGSNFLSVMHRLLGEGKRIKAISDSFGTPTFASDLAKRIRELTETGASGVFHAANSGEGTSYFGFAKNVCEIGGFDTGLIEAVSGGDLKRPAPRPNNSRLKSAGMEKLGLRPLPPWQDALRRFLERSSDSME